ncbi:VOC family protein [Nocardiopsis alba]|uniref:VOC family protein n=1 Tax=Nocardiopsis alba TaxID=53437 RepID=UPI0035D6818E
MITTDFVVGSPRWLELGSDAPIVSADFYGRVFGWRTQTMGERFGDYLVMRSTGEAVGGIGPRIVDDEPPAWTPYFHTDDVETSVHRARDLGGTLEVEPTDVRELGRMAHLTDPQGGWFALWEPGTFSSLQAVDRPNTLCWVEMWTSDVQGAKEFYRGLFGWRYDDIPLPGGDSAYTTLRPIGMGEERYFGGFMGVAPEQLPRTDGAADWHPIFQVADCDATASAVLDAGGRVHMGPEYAPGVGLTAVCSDPSAAGFVLLDPEGGHG